jgi:SSS family solute:Na+ symporter
MNLPLIDVIVIIVYTLGIVAFGASFYFRSKSSDAFTKGGGRIPAWALGMSIFATFVSSISFLALPGKAYQTNWNSFAFSLSIPIATWVAVKYFVPLFRSINSVSAYAYLETRFGPWARVYASSCYLLTQLARTGSILFLLALPLNALLGWDVNTIIIVTGILTMVYSMMGGIQAVVWTDAVQGFVLIGGALVCLIILMFSAPGGIAQSIDIALQHDKFSLGSFDFDWSTSTFWVVLIYGLFINLQNFGIDQNYVQRYITAKTEKEAKFSTWLGGLLYVPVSLLFFLIGTFLFTYYQANPEALPAELQTPQMADRVFPYFIVKGLPVGFTGLLIASIFAAGMSTISTSLNSGATVILTDFYKRFASSVVTEKQSMRVLYISSAVIAVVGILVGLAMTKVQSTLDAWWALSSIFSGGMLGLFLLGYMSKRASSMQAAIGVIAGIVVICWISLSPAYFSSTLHTNMAIVLGTAAIFIVGFLLGTLFNKKPVS